MTRKFSLEILTADQIGHLFLEYILEKNIPARIREQVGKKIYFVPEREDEMFEKRLKTEYYKWTKQVDIPGYLRESGWESFVND